LFVFSYSNKFISNEREISFKTRLEIAFLVCLFIERVILSGWLSGAPLIFLIFSLIQTSLTELDIPHPSYKNAILHSSLGVYERFLNAKQIYKLAFKKTRIDELIVNARPRKKNTHMNTSINKQTRNAISKRM
jgi:hypothetical protein